MRGRYARRARAHTGTFASGFITFAGIAIVGAILLAIVGRSWSGTFLTRGRTSFAFALEEA